MLDRKALRQWARWSFLGALVVMGGGLRAFAQAPTISPGPVVSDVQLLSPEQLGNVVAPIALYPDQLLSEVLAASTYPLEIVEAQQWLQQRGNLQGIQLMDAARQQNWDASVQALTAFPDAMALLSRDVQWTTALGNAFLAQQADVMNAIQQMRARAQSNGRLRSGPQQVVTAQYQDGQNAIEIQPPNPQVMYVPSYNPQNIWGPPAGGGYYPQLGYQSGYAGQSGYYGQPSYGGQPGYGGEQGYGGQQGYGGGSDTLGEIFGAATNLASFFTGFGGLLTGGWGWILSWFTHSLLLNGLFFNSFGFHGGGGYGGGYGGGFYGGARSAWVHDPGHRMGVPYSNALVAHRFGGTFRPVSAGFGSRGFNSGSSFSVRNGSGGRTQEFAGNRGFSSSFNGAGSASSGWHSPSGNRSFEGAGRSFESSGRSSEGSSRSFGGSTFASNAFSGNNRGFSSSGFGSGEVGSRGYGSGFASSGYRSSGSSGMSSGYRSGSPPAWNSSPRSSFASPDRSGSRNDFTERASNQHFSQPKFSQPHYSQPKVSSQHFSAPKAPHFSAPKAPRGGGGGGHSSGGHGSGGHSHKH